jgi:phosphoribosylanthranilate isomerase
MKVKICGITSLDDALAAIDAGADLLGFNFYPPSPRYVTPAECARIQSAIRNQQSAITIVGVFVNEPLLHIAEIMEQCALDFAQLHGDEPPEIIERLEGRAFKAIRPRSLDEARAAASRYAIAGQPAILLDASHPNLYGGTGQTADWPLAREIAQRHPILLAGGLTPDNVADAIRVARPWGVDVASGVESSPGRKDHRKLVRFVQAARNAIPQPA